jgi:hypothetical protein
VLALVLSFSGNVFAQEPQQSRTPKLSKIVPVPLPDPANDSFEQTMEIAREVAQRAAEATSTSQQPVTSEMNAAIVAAVNLAMATAAEKVAKPSACEISTKGLEKPQRKLIELKCELEKAELSRQIREAGKSKPDASSDSIGVAASNKAVTTVTYRDANGVALEGSAGWAKHEENMAKIKNGPSDPCMGKMAWFTCPAPVVLPVVVNRGYQSFGGGYRFEKQPHVFVRKAPRVQSNRQTVNETGRFGGNVQAYGRAASNEVVNGGGNVGLLTPAVPDRSVNSSGPGVTIKR